MDIPSSNLGNLISSLTGSNKPTIEKAGTAPAAESDSKTVAAPAVTAAVSADSTAVKPAVVEDHHVVEDVAPTVEHDTLTKEHEQKEQTVIDKETHQDHYHTTVQTAKTQEVLPEQHTFEDTATEVKEIEHDDGAVKENAAARNSEFHDTTEEGKTVEKKTDLPTAVATENVHHHLHETIQPVIEKEIIQPQVTHKTIHVKEVHHDKAVDEGTTTEAPVSVEELEERVGRITEHKGEERY
ncbi:hypothetical protein LTR37_007862 [Vermiconidia calcicola]|uniref:Uncharacterized protein n=1 Tax=Vermiconidia calcicola TaxID=1690605 RepID=A0ACC3NDE6_9PEZI|nr:hypothetical protein LTR37_007862 [Vermiconidia calcicola]